MLINGDQIDAFSVIIHDGQGVRVGPADGGEAAELIPRQQFEVAIQAAIGNRIIARETDQGDAQERHGEVLRRRHHAQAQAPREAEGGKKRMKQVGTVEIPQEAFLAVLQVGDLNRLDNVVIENVAVSDSNGTASFAFGTGSGTGRLSADGAIEVRTVRLDDYCDEHDVAPGVMKIDVEGAELDVLRGADRIIGAHHPIIFLSTHGEEVHAGCLEWLRERSYDLRSIDGETLESAREVLCT
jgi:FkbM family methyltransferase